MAHVSERVPLDAYPNHELEFHIFGEMGTGPRVLVTAGIHGGEATGIWAARKLLEWLENRPLRGTVTVLPVANPAAFRNLTRNSPYDEIDMNRNFPGNPDGSASLVAADAIWERAKRSDFVVDLHCCGLFGSDYTLALYEEFPFVRELAAKLDIPVVVQSGGTRAQLFVEACYAGIPAVIIELAGGQVGVSGGLLNQRSGINALVAVTNLLMRLGVAEGNPPAANPTFYGKLAEVSCLRTALWSPAVAPGGPVEAGTVMGDLDGEPVLAPATGVATSVRGQGYVFPGYTLSMVAPIAAS